MQIIGDGKVLGIPYLPVTDGKKRERFNSDHPNWQPEWDFRDHLTKDDREDIPFPFTEFPDISKDEPDRRGGRPGNAPGSGNGRRPNATTDPVLRGGGRPNRPGSVQDAVGIPDWQETAWDEFVNTPGAIGGIDKPIPYDPEGSTKEPPSPGGTRGPQHNECSNGKIPHWRYGGNHTPSSTLIQFRVWLYTAYSPKRAIVRRKDDGVEHVYFQNRVDPYVKAYFGAGKHVPVIVLPIDGINGRTENIYGFKSGYPWFRGETSWTQQTTLLFMPKRKVRIRHSEWTVYWPIPNTPRDVTGRLAWFSNRATYAATIDCEMSFSSPSIPPNYSPPGKPYNRGNEMGCQWQKDEVDYSLPELKIGTRKIGGSAIKIDDGLVPLADYLIKAMSMMHSGLGLDLLDITDLPTSVLKPDDNKVKHKSLAELTQWQFDNVSSLVGLPIKNTLTTIDDKTSDLEFRSVQDALSFMFHQQKESDTDLTVLEGYCTRIAQQLEAVTQICLRQHADIEMIIQELGFKYKIETKTRPSLYKIGMKDDDPKTGVIELFKGGIVSYPVRIWADEHDQRQIAMRTNLYAEISARSILQSKNTKDEIAGLDAMKKMNKNNKEDWAEYIKTINEPESGTISGSRTPYIEEYVSGTLGTKKIPSPTSGLSLFRKPKQTGKIR